jgi:propionyl-CoA carboxylase beta chain
MNDEWVNAKCGRRTVACKHSANPYIAAARGYIDDVIEPHQTRAKLIAGLEMLQNKRDTNPPKKHGNLPL